MPISHHCEVCGTEVTGNDVCPDHPNATVQSVLSAPKSINVSATHVDTCLSCYLTDHHNRDGELLIGIEPRGQSVDDAASEAADEVRALCDGGDRFPSDITTHELRLTFKRALRGVDLKAIDETSPADDDDSSDRAQVWLLLEWETV